MKLHELYTQFDSIFFEKTRLSMITILHKEGVVSFNRFKKIIKGTDGAIYAHAKKLLNAGYITGKKKIAQDKIQTVYSLTISGQELFMGYLQFLENMLITGKGKEGGGTRNEKKHKKIKSKL